MTDIRAIMLQVISEESRNGEANVNLQSNSTLRAVHERTGRGHEVEQTILTAFHDLFRTGYLAWGFNLANPNPPFYHVTVIGRRMLSRLGRDPGNAEGYMAYVHEVGRIGAITLSYLAEALACFRADLPKAAAVMAGAAAESLVLEIRDLIVSRLAALGKSIPKSLSDWKIKTILDAVADFIETSKANVPYEVKQEFDAYWPAFTQQIRAARNEAGHPSSVDPISIDTVHASLLIFPELARLAFQLREWIPTYK